MKFTRLAGLAVIGAMAASSAGLIAQADTDSIDYQITSPYANVDWSWGQYKTGLHNHTTESDGGNSAREMLTQAYDLGFNVFAITDHNVMNDSWVGTYKEGALRKGEQPKADYYMTQQEVDDMAAGVGRDGAPGMLGIPNTNEQSVKDHLNTFWAPWNNAQGDTLESKIDYVSKLKTDDALQPLQHINHPGRYYGGSNKQLGPNGEDLGALAATDPAKVARYVDLFENYGGKNLIGMEVVNKVGDGDSYSDRILWDSVLAETMPEVNVYGFSNDDAHSTGALGYDYQWLLMPEFNLETVHATMQSGAWYTSALVAKRELGADFKGDRTKPAPTISNIVVDQKADSISITADHHNTIEWIADGKVIATGDTLMLDEHSANIDNYVRAQIKGDNGITFTNAFGIDMNVKSNNGRFLSDSEAAQAALASIDRTTGEYTVKRDFKGKNKSFVVCITTADGVQSVRVNAETGAIL